GRRGGPQLHPGAADDAPAARADPRGGFLRGGGAARALPDDRGGAVDAVAARSRAGRRAGLPHRARPLYLHPPRAGRVRQRGARARRALPGCLLWRRTASHPRGGGGGGQDAPGVPLLARYDEAFVPRNRSRHRPGLSGVRRQPLGRSARRRGPLSRAAAAPSAGKSHRRAAGQGKSSRPETEAAWKIPASLPASAPRSRPPARSTGRKTDRIPAASSRRGGAGCRPVTNSAWLATSARMASALSKAPAASRSLWWAMEVAVDRSFCGSTTTAGMSAGLAAARAVST